MKTGDGLSGMYSFLKQFPCWLTIMMLMLLMASLLVGRGILDGLPYNIASSSFLGENVLFITVVLIAITVLQRPGKFGVPHWFCSSRVQVLIYLVCLGLCFLVSTHTIDLRSGRWMDVYHDLAIAPLVVFLLIILLPVIYKNGTGTENKVTLCLLLLWGSLFGLDMATGMLAQCRWLQEHFGMMLK
ncbi:MAG: hypothetical protein UR90_C0007G0026 [Parcubacteria group bacterium GW2011_GWC1_35_8]|nr:MAG: hypothetical protein UR90_C0007G0026 [Parcubacteria group bacterium GW2011_GWC1_35_8]